jgi:hypothetical protein
MTTVKIDDCGKGVNKDLAPHELELGVWSDCRNFRFRNGFAEKWEGVTTYFNPLIATYWCSVFATAATRYIVYAGLQKVYAYVPSSAAQTEITRYTDGVEIASITRVGTTATLTTTGNHGRTTGDAFSTYGNFPDQYNVTSTLTVTSPTTFTYTIASDPGSSATTLGAYTYNATSNFTGTADDRITGGILNGVQIINNPVNGLYYWAGDTSIRVRKVPFSYVADVGRVFKDFIVQLAPTIGGTKYPFDVIWSNSAEPGSIPTTFTAAATNDAGRQPLPGASSPAVDCLPLDDVNIIYTYDARYSMRHVEGNDVFVFDRLPGTDGLLARQCVVDTPKGHVFLTPDLDVKIHQGGQAVSIAEGRIRNFIRNGIALTLAGKARSFLAVNPLRNEVWVCYIRFGETECSLIAAWNWENDTWGLFDLADIGSGHPTNAATGPVPIASGISDLTNAMLVCTTSSSKFGLAKPPTAFSAGGTGTYLDQALTWSLERQGLSLGDQDTYKTLHRSRWNWAPTSGTAVVTVYHGASTLSTANPTYASPASVTTGFTEYANARSTSGRFLAIKMSSAYSVGTPFALRSIDLDVTGGGKR